MFLLYDVLRCLSNCFKCLRIFYIVFHLLYFISVFFEIFKKTNSILCLKLFIYPFIFHMLDQMLDQLMTILTQYFYRDVRHSRIYWVGGSVRGHLIVRGRVNVLQRSALINKRRDLGMIFQGGDSRRNASSAEQSQGQKVWSNNKSNIPDNSTDEDKYQEET